MPDANTQYIVTKQELDDIAIAIQNKTGLSTKLHWPNEMINAIDDIIINPPATSVDWTGNGSVNINSNKVLKGTWFYNSIGSLESGTISTIDAKSETATLILKPSAFAQAVSFPSGFYINPPRVILDTNGTSTITITPSSTTQTITLFGSGATYNYFPKAIRITGTSSGQGNIEEEMAEYIKGGLMGSLSNSYVTIIKPYCFASES